MPNADRIAAYSRANATAASIRPFDVGVDSWQEIEGVRAWQAEHCLVPDGWFGPASVRAFRRSQTGGAADQIRIFDAWYTVPGVADVEYRPNVLAGRARRSGTAVNCVLLHQSVTRSRKGTERVLQKRGLGVCALIEPNGRLTVYGDLGARRTAHGNERNNNSVGLEIVNPYYPSSTGGNRYAPRPWSDVRAGRTAHKGYEIVDTDEQIATAAAFLEFICGQTFEGPGNRSIEIPRAFPTTGDEPTRGHRAWFDQSVGGVLAHGHRPGTYPPGHPKRGQRTRSHADARLTAVLLRQRLGWHA